MSGYPDTTPSPPIRARCGSRDVGSHTALGGCGRMVIGDTGEDIMRACIGVLMSALLLVAAVTVSGCKSTGTGSGESRTGDVKATFTWEQTGPSQGTLHATVIDPGGNTDIYDGKFYQVTRDSRIETLGGLWDPWYPTWGGWAFWGPTPSESFVQHYTGHVLANLSDAQGQRMRCQFQLLRAGEGMKGGGQGQCQLPSGKTITTEFPPT